MLDYAGGAYNQNAALKLAGGDGSTVSSSLNTPGTKVGHPCFVMAIMAPGCH